MRHHHHHSHHGMPHDEPDTPENNDLYNPDDIELTTVGIDIGSSTSHLIFSRLHLRRMGKNLSSRYVVVKRETLHRSPILLTPYRSDYTIDAEQLHSFIRQAFEAAALTPDEVDSGAIILTGEAVKRTNARAIADLFASQAGKFVCASAGHNLEAFMAAHGSGAVAASRASGNTVLNVDVGGGTSKLALTSQGEILDTAAINVGGRLVAMDSEGRVIRIEPAARLVADELGIELRLDGELAPDDQRRLADALAACLMEVIRGEALSPLTEQLMLTPAGTSRTAQPDAVSFSGGVAEYLYERQDDDFLDLAQPLAEAIQTRVAAGALPAPLQMYGEPIRATVIGASQFTVQVSGDTIAVSRPDLLPIHNLQVLYPRLPDSDDVSAKQISIAIRESFERFGLEEGEQTVAVAIDWNGVPHYRHMRALAEGIVRGLSRSIAVALPLVLVFTNDFGKLVGDILRDELNIRSDVISIDSIELKDLDYIDIGAIIYPARVVPVVVKSLVFPEVQGARAELVER